MRARLRADVAVMNGGGIRGNQIVPAGSLTRRDINALLPFLNVLVMLEVPGKVLRDVLERSVAVYPQEFGGFLQVSGLTFVFDPAGRPASASCGCWWAASPWTPSAATPWPPTATRPGGGDGYAMLATAKPLVFPEDGPGLAETLLEAIERAGVDRARHRGTDHPDQPLKRHDA